ncbi:TPA: hypothetical protein PWY45_001940 [Mannheimia haemolytica]|nr:hypothetical protein J450_01615 [Mannheimia haemolytica D171]EEY09234.1 hypothetical protein COI_2160 [Mannheimia haemolytica serotype A2 str. OVINE]EEY13224.1 hypothetical protein COK_0657 [Mannheimia haemolytica serotype A2 str. BOVINE]KYL16312.1 hypothetical protein AC571_07735 [Mannheimia haemolytica]KYL21930.1 hypothetical protein AC574_09240 [Mannheimia haemolytica]
MSNYSKTKLKIHLKKGLEMETNASPIMRGAIAISIVLIALGVFALCVTPLANVLIEMIK